MLRFNDGKSLRYLRKRSGVRPQCESRQQQDPEDVVSQPAQGEGPERGKVKNHEGLFPVPPLRPGDQGSVDPDCVHTLTRSTRLTPLTRSRALITFLR